ncbi:MAG: DNRLRE domain-containing protein [Candidatus Krumholzibacteriota bacterium]|nr:DNRLRE domain-containing protein [Candidatus Krumholzibacteriota bacterium]
MSHHHLPRILAALLAISLLAAGCSDLNSPTGPADTASPAGLRSIVLPENATLDAAILRLYSADPADTTVYVHRVIAPWDENTVTWSNFGGAYAPEVLATFGTPLPPGYVEVDITDLVLAWADSTYENHGLLLRQDDFTDRNTFWSREHDTDHPQLVIRYTTPVGPDSLVVEPLADTFIWEITPDANYGTEARLYTGWRQDTDLEKQALLRFDILDVPDDEQEGCTRTIGYWKNHAGFGPQADVVSPLLPVWLGEPGGEKSLAVIDPATAVAVLQMKTYGRPNNGVTKLYAQLLGAKLNLTAGACDCDIADALVEADAFLADHDWNDWAGLDADDRAMVLGLKDLFDGYNNGDIGPGHCD